MRAIAELSAASLAVGELIAGLDGAATRAELHRRVRLEGPAEAAELELAIDGLTRRVLAIEGGGQLRLVGAARTFWVQPLGLHPSASRLLRQLERGWAERAAATLGLARGGSAAKQAEAVAAALTPERVLGLLAQAAPDGRDAVLHLAERGGLLQPPVSLHLLAPTPWRHESELTWLLDHALLLPVGWDALAVPREVALAVRGDEWSVTLPLRPPELVTAAVAQEAVERESQAAAIAVVASVTELLEQLSAAPAPTLSAGGLGGRELRRLAKAVGRGEREVTLAAHLADAAALLDGGDRVEPSETYPSWRSEQPAVRLVRLLAAWWAFPAALTGRVDDKGKASPPLQPFLRDDESSRQLRHALLASVAGLPDGRGVTGLATVLDRLSWERPLTVPCGHDHDEDVQHADGSGHEAPPVYDATVLATWDELERLGLVAHGRASSLGEALLAGDEAVLLARAEAALPPMVEQVVFQADLTAVVPGSPSAQVAELLDEVADREGRGTASTWRFSPASVRRAIDTGATSTEILDRLATVAAGDLPQPLVYLVNDVARRHGHLSVVPLACAVLSEDPALLAEVAGTRSLAPLAPRLLAPTVLASARPVPETLALLRAAGYAPVRRDAQGQLVLEHGRRHRTPSERRGAQRRANTAIRHLFAYRDEPAADPDALAQVLLDAAAGKSPEDLALPD